MFRVSCCCGISLGWEHLVLSSSGILFFLLLTLSILREGGGGGWENTSHMTYNACQAKALHRNLIKAYIFIKSIKFLCI